MNIKDNEIWKIVNNAYGIKMCTLTSRKPFTLVSYKPQIKMVIFQVLTATSMKMAVFWDVVPCIALMMEVVSSSETLVNIYQAIQHNIPEDSPLHNLKLSR
jgi:hypothetical protein